MNALLCTCWRCPYAMRARKALMQADVALDASEIVLGGKPAEMLALWPTDGGTAHKAPPLALLTACDGPFKHHLDHTKYPERFGDIAIFPFVHQLAAVDAVWWDQQPCPHSRLG